MKKSNVRYGVAAFFAFSILAAAAAFRLQTTDAQQSGGANGTKSESFAPQATFTVNSLLDTDDGTCDVLSCTLREAINAANIATGLDTITFTASGTINVGASPGPTAGTPLPDITSPVVIEGGGTVNQNCALSSTIVLVLNGASSGLGSNGLTLAAGSTGSTIRGLNIQAFDGNGVEILSSSNVVSGSFIGTNQAGTAAAGNNTNGVNITSGTDNRIGGGSPGFRNVISGNGGLGISISGFAGAARTTIQGNYIGTDATGAVDLGNAFDGVDIFQSAGNIIGGVSSSPGCGQGNLISGNNEDGVSIFGASSVNNTVQGNAIGTNAAGTMDLGNTSQGVYIGSSSNTVGGTSSGLRNLISGNDGGGVNLGGGSNNVVQGNYIGTNAAGAAALRNPDGVRLDNATTSSTIGGVVAAGGPTAYGVRSDGMLFRFGVNAPGSIVEIGTVTGLQAGELIRGIDFRPSNRLLYALGSTSRMYVINTATAVATQVGGPMPFTPALSGTEFGFDFNPVANANVGAIRIVSNTGQNLRIHPDTLVVTNDTALNPGTPQITAAGYTFNDADPTTTGTTLYTIDSGSDVLNIQTPPNNGTQVMVGSLGVDTTAANAFDINTSGSNVAYAALTVGGMKNFYDINLTTGAATLRGTIANGTGMAAATVVGLAIEIGSVEPLVAYGVTPTNQLTRFSAVNPAIVTTVGTITGLNAGESILGIDFRPATRQLYALGSASRVYTINTGTAAATPVGPGTLSGATINGTEFGIDFNPVVDRLRIVSNTGQNLRVHPDTLVVTTDMPLNGAATMADGAGYINNFAGTAATTLFDIDAATDTLYTQNPPNNGTLVVTGPLGVNATDVNGFDVNTIGGTNTAYASLNVGGVQNLYTVNTATGTATLVGPIGNGATGMSGLAFEIGSPSAFSAANVISGNDVGVHIADGSSNFVRGNFIGTGADGGADVGNLEAGVYIQQAATTGNFIGGTTDGDGNSILFNGDGILIATLFGEGGVVVFGGSTGNRLHRNSISANTGLGIDLDSSATPAVGADGVTPNDPGDADSGDANNLQNYPMLTSATSSSVSGTLTSTPSRTFRIEFFSDTVADPSGNGEGRVFIGSTNVTTNAAGAATFSAMTLIVSSGVVSSNATDLTTGDTSEFSNTVIPPTAANASLGGRIVTGDGRGIRGVRVTLTDSDGNIRRAITGSFGYYQFDDLPTGETYVISVASKRYQFNPSSVAVNLSDSVTDVNFTAQP